MAASSRWNAAVAPAPAVVLSGNIDPPNGRSLNEAALALTRSLGRHGVPIVRFHPDRRLADLSSRYCVHRACPNLYDDPDGLAGALETFARECSTTPVLFPASDGAARFIATYAPRLARSFALTSPSAECIAKTQDKRTLLELAARSGVGTPTTHYPQCPEELESFADTLTYPVVVKPLVSSAWKTAAAVTALGERVKALTPSGPAELLALGRRLWRSAHPSWCRRSSRGRKRGYSPTWATSGGMAASSPAVSARSSASGRPASATAR